jgi:hypothetical protein
MWGVEYLLKDAGHSAIPLLVLNEHQPGFICFGEDPYKEYVVLILCQHVGNETVWQRGKPDTLPIHIPSRMGTGPCAGTSLL